MEAPVVPARRTCELSGHREPHLDEDSLRSTLLLSFSDAQPARTTTCGDTRELPSPGDRAGRRAETRESPSPGDRAHDRVRASFPRRPARHLPADKLTIFSGTGTLSASEFACLPEAPRQHHSLRVGSTGMGATGHSPRPGDPTPSKGRRGGARAAF